MSRVYFLERSFPTHSLPVLESEFVRLIVGFAVGELPLLLVDELRSLLQIRLR